MYIQNDGHITHRYGFGSDAFNHNQEELLHRIKSHHNQRALAECIQLGMRDQALAWNNRSFKGAVAPAKESELRDLDEQPAKRQKGGRRPAAHSPSPEPSRPLPLPLPSSVQFELRPHPSEKREEFLKRPYLTTTVLQSPSPV